MCPIQMAYLFEMGWTRINSPNNSSKNIIKQTQKEKYTYAEIGTVLLDMQQKMMTDNLLYINWLPSPGLKQEEVQKKRGQSGTQNTGHSHS